jgi:hypothetical protein
MSAFSSAATAASEASPKVNPEAQHAGPSSPNFRTPCGRAPTWAESAAWRRVRFLGRFIYWSCKHGSTKHAAWVCHYEGLYW